MSTTQTIKANGVTITVTSENGNTCVSCDEGRCGSTFRDTMNNLQAMSHRSEIVTTLTCRFMMIGAVYTAITLVFVALFVNLMR